MSGFDRREFLKVAASAGGGLVLGFYLPACARRPGVAGAATAAAFELNAFIEIDTAGSVRLTAPVPEIGQGVKTSLPRILAEELAVDWERVRIEQAEGDADRYGWQTAGGSLATSLSWLPLRRAGAAARTILVRAAAERWGVEVGELTAASGRVRHAASGRELGYGELVAAAARLEPPDPETVELTPPAEFRLLGRPVPGVDNRELVTGASRFGLDQRMPGMLTASIERSPVFGGRVRRFEAEAALAVPGVLQVLAMDESVIAERFERFDAGVAVLAEHTWAAFEGRRALAIEWDDGPGSGFGSEELRRRARARLATRGDEIVREDGDVEAALAGAHQVLEAEYEVAMLAHAPLEPMNCLADLRDGRCHVVAPTQSPDDVRSCVARATGLPEEAVRVEVSRSGGGFGRRLQGDYSAEAAWLSLRAGRPVQVVWSREDDLRHDYYRTPSFHRLRAGLDADGRLVAWRHRLASPSRNVFRERADEPAADTELYPDEFPALFVPALRFEFSHLPFAPRLGPWRGIAHTSNAFPIGSFLDELAWKAGRDPLEFHRELLGEARAIELPRFRWDLGRLLAVLERAADAAGWGGPLPAGRGRGLAYYAYTQARKVTCVAHVVEAAVDTEGRIRVERVVSAVDCGIVVNPLGVEAQMQGGILDGLSTALHGEITVEEGRVVQGNFDDYPLLALDEAPSIEVHILPTDNDPAGMGEPPIPPVAPALGNALFAATGRRLRRLPFRSEDLAT